MAEPLLYRDPRDHKTIVSRNEYHRIRRGMKKAGTWLGRTSKFKIKTAGEIRGAGYARKRHLVRTVEQMQVDPATRQITNLSQMDIDALRAVVHNPVMTFVPTEPQSKFLALNSFIQIFSGANWAGKTSIGIIKLSCLIWDTPNQFIDYGHIHSFPRRTRGRVVSTHTAIENDTIPALKKWFPRGRYSMAKAGRTFESKWSCDNGTEFDIMTYDQKPEEFESVKLDWILFDEPPPLSIFNATVARMKPHGIIMVAMTPLSGAAWLFDRINNPWSGRTWGVIYADIESACIQHGVRGYLPHDAIQKKIENYDPDEREARIKGLPMHLQGLVYKSFNRPVHVVPYFEPPSDWTRYQVVDPHDRKPFAAIWAAVNPQGKIFIYNESPDENFYEIKSCSITVKDYARLFRQKEETSGGSARARVMDARYGNRNSVQTGKTIRDLFDDEGLIYNDSYTDEGASIDAGHQEVKELLSLGPDGTPHLVVMDNCKNTIYGFEHYCWPDIKHYEAALKEKPDEKFKDFMDTVRYLAKEGPRYIPDQPAPAGRPKWAEPQGAIGYGVS